MAYASLVSLAQTIHKLLQHYDQGSTFPHEIQQMKCLHEYLFFLQAFLEDFPDKLAHNFEARIRDVANQAEDIIEHFILKEIRSGLKFSQHETGLRLHFDFGTLNQKLQKITEEINFIVGEVKEIKNCAGSTEDLQLHDFSAVASSSSSRQLAPTNRDAMVGFDDDLMEIRGRLRGEPSNLEVIPILGMGGIGKTTLAKNAFDDPLITEYFDIRAWVTISQNYDAREILLGLQASIKGERSEQGDVSQVAISVYQSLKNRRYFIVMDDMWSTNVWDDLQMIFPDDNNRSRIMLTTRLYDVAAYPDSCGPLYKMRFMDPDQSWNLLKHKVFTREDCPPELEPIGKMIARSCGGLPLAIVLIGGLLMVSKTQASWENIATNVSRAISTTNDEQLTKILSLSYIRLPHHLRPCFLYMGGFPEDREIHVSKLIKLWVAEGFLKPLSGTSRSFEEVAEEYLENLVKRSLVLVNRRNASGKIKKCYIHDLVWDLCTRRAQEDSFLQHIIRNRSTHLIPKGLKNQRRISVAHLDLDCHENICSNIHTIICFHGSGSSLGFLGNFRLLRVLDVVNISDVNLVVRLPNEVFELFHLRYLAFSYSGRFYLTPSIFNLQNLQTLIIINTRVYWSFDQYTVCLPSEIWKMPQLRHLVSISFGLLPNPEEGAAFALENLHTLSYTIDFICTTQILKMVPNLKKLGIYFKGQETPFANYHLENLVYLHQLEKLKLRTSPAFPFWQKLNPVFPTSLKKLGLTGGRHLAWKDMGKIVGSLPNLEVLKLRYFACYGETWETSEGEFPQLKLLLIDQSKLRYWITESSHFQSLKCLLVHNCEDLSEIPDAIGEIPTLELIEVDDRNKSLVDSAKRIREEQQENWGNVAFQVRVVRAF